jgi:hypothetical protein
MFAISRRRLQSLAQRNKHYEQVEADAGDSNAVVGDCRLPPLSVDDQARDKDRTVYGSRGEMNGRRNGAALQKIFN